MSGIHRMAIVIAVLAIALCAQMAFAQSGPYLRYIGETADTGSAWYTGPISGGDDCWDYVYELYGTESWSPQYPYFFAVWCEAYPSYWTTPDSWMLAPPPMTPIDHRGGAVAGKPGLIFALTRPPQPGRFTFGVRMSSGPGPDWTPATGWGQSGDDITFVPAEAAVPEPASMALTSLCLLGVAAWKRRKAR